jgi:Kef-type K+ transport system membrane component KefB
MLHALQTLPLLAAGSGAEIRSLLVLLGIIAAAYLITHLLVERLQRRFGFVTGIEYILIGVLVGPVLGLLDARTMEMFTPAIVLGTGSLGLLTGMRLRVKSFGARDVEALRVAMWVTLGTSLMIIGLPMLGLWLHSGAKHFATALPLLLGLNAVAVAADPGPIAALRRFLLARGTAADLAIRTCQMCAALAVIAFGLIFCIHNPGSVLLRDELAPLEWLALHLLIGLLLGVLFAMFLRRDLNEEQTLTVIIGVVIFTSGLAYSIKLSPIFVNFVLGLVLTNLSRHGEEVEKRLVGVERPLYIILFFSAGAKIAFEKIWWVYPLVVPALLLRIGGRSLGSLIAARTGEDRGMSLGRVLLTPGGLSVAMALNFLEVYGAWPLARAAYGGLVLFITASEILSYRRTRAWLIDYTDVPPNTIDDALSGHDAEVA